MASNDPINIDVDALLKSKIPGYYRYIPHILIKWLSRVVCEKELNGILGRCHGKEGVDFADAVLADLNIKLTVSGKENLPAAGSGRYIFVSNHPLGGLDGISLISFLGHQYCGKIRCLVNDLLMQVKPFENIFLPANKHGHQSQAVVKAIDESFAGEEQILIFPAGLCSRSQRGGIIADLSWQKSFITKSIESRRDIVPVYFDGRNSNFFYKFAKLRKRIGLKYNIEMIYLPSEVFKSRNKEFTITIGKPIPWHAFTETYSPKEWAGRVKQTVYNLKND